MATILGNNNNNRLTGTGAADIIRGRDGNDILIGLGGNDVMYGGNGNDRLFGGPGEDVLYGGPGNDLLTGGPDGDEFYGDAGIDTVNYAASTTKVIAYLASNLVGYGAFGDKFYSVENVIGSAFDDILQPGVGGYAYGGKSGDSLAGNSTASNPGGLLRGDAGADYLDMKFGATTAWVQFGQGFDTIDNFIEGQDMLFIDLSDLGLGKIFDASDIANSSSGSATGNHAQIVFETDAYRLWVDINGAGAGGLQQIATFVGSTFIDANLDVGDFDFQL